MPKISKKHITLLGSTAGAALLLWGCASIGSPSGGPRDEDPPRFIAANPAPGSVNVDPSNINIDFNELVNVKDAFQNVVLSPPGKTTPRVSTRGRRVIVNITDTLLPNTTYTIDFGDAIEDNNEANKLSGFAYTFSTGPTLDSLRISGMVLGAEDMEPQQGVFVGAYISKEDSAFIRMPFERLARTDEYGRFIIRGLQDTTYRLFALKDLDNDKHYANPEEDIAWFEDIIRPTSERITASDTIRDLYTGAIDTIMYRERTRFLPNNVLLRMYNTGLKPQYLVSYTRPDSTRLEFIFNSSSNKRPQIMIADDEVYSEPLKGESTIGNDTLKFWLPTELATRDTLKLAMSYPRIDLLTGIESMVEDTVKLIKPKPQEKKKKQNKKKLSKKADSGKGKQNLIIPTDSVAGLPSDSIANQHGESMGGESENSKSDNDNDAAEEEEKKAPTFSFNAKGPDSDIRRPLTLEAPVPVSKLDTLAFRLEMKQDTLWKQVKGSYRLERADTLSERRFKIEYPWERGITYRVVADSLAATDIYGVESQKLEYEFKTKAPEELSNLKLNLNGLEPGIPAFVELIASGDKPKYSAPVINGVAKFDGIDAGKYYARLYEDFNGDGKYTPGSYRLQKIFGEPTDTIAKPDTTCPSDTILAYEPFIPGAPNEFPQDSLITTGKDDHNKVALPLDSIGNIAADSIATLIADSIASIKDKDVFRHPMSDKEITDSLRRAGYSLNPIETDSVGRDYLIAIQPDYVYYYPKTINVKKNWDVEQTWNVFETALDLQKPDKLKKNKPKRTNQQRQEDDDEEDDDEFGANPFAPNRTNNNRNSNRNNQGNSRLRMQN